MLTAAAPKECFYICGRCIEPSERDFLHGTTTMAGVCVRCDGQAVWLMDRSVEEPRVAYHGGSPVFSTSQVLARRMVWDVNGYYAGLGVSPYASRKEIGRAYQALNGADDPWLTHVISVLLDETQRAKYDSCSLGEIYVDRWIIEAILRKAHDRTRGIRDTDEDDLPEGFEAYDPTKEVADLEGEAMDADYLDNALDADQDALHRNGRQRLGTSSSWGFFQWRSTQQNEGTLREWRRLLVMEFSTRGVNQQIGVGYMKDKMSVAVVTVGTTKVAFLSEDTWPTASLASEVVDLIVGA